MQRIAKSLGILMAASFCLGCRGFSLVRPMIGLQRSIIRNASPFDADNDRLRTFEAQTGKRVFEALVEYPCDFQIRVIGREDASFVNDMLEYIGRVTETPVDEISFSTNPSSKGTFISVSIDAPIDSAQTLYECYAILRQDPRVKVAL
uniref:Uncharacterized protein n=1 Tax=Aureoumbra lagunensis TaxID=44058 RepID=A0A7S3NIF1_9STRA